MTDTVVRAKVSPEIKAAAMTNAKILGLDLSTVIRMVINTLAVKGELPIGLLQPNKETIEAIRDLEKGHEIHHADTIDDLKRDLGW